MGLNERQELFCQEMAKGMLPTEAARAVGYRTPNVRASELMDMPKVLSRIADLKDQYQKATAEKVSIDKAWVIEQLVENVHTAKQAVAVLDREGNETGTYEQNLTAANRALELIGKELGMFVDRKEVRTGPLFADLTDEQLDAAIVAARALATAEAPRAGESATPGRQPAQGVPAVREAG